MIIIQIILITQSPLLKSPTMIHTFNNHNILWQTKSTIRKLILVRIRRIQVRLIFQCAMQSQVFIMMNKQILIKLLRMLLIIIDSKRPMISLLMISAVCRVNRPTGYLSQKLIKMKPWSINGISNVVIANN